MCKLACVRAWRSLIVRVDERVHYLVAHRLFTYTYFFLILLHFLFVKGLDLRRCRGVCYCLGSLYIRYIALFLYQVVYLCFTLCNLFFNHETLVPIHFPIHLAFVHIINLRFSVSHALLVVESKSALIDLFLLFFLIIKLHALGHHVLAATKRRDIFSGSVNFGVHLLSN